MFEQGNSSSESDNFLGLGKKVQYKGNILQSQQGQNENQNDIDQSSSQQLKEPRKNYTRKISELKAQPHDSKNKMIKKNSVSAKMSRQRKKIYIELLQQKAEALKNQIISTKESIQNQKTSIMTIINQSNPQKYQYIVDKIRDSKNLVKFIQQYQEFKNVKEQQKDHSKSKSQLGEHNKEVNHYQNKQDVMNVQAESKNLPYQNHKKLHQDKASPQKDNFIQNYHKNSFSFKFSKENQEVNYQNQFDAYINSFMYKFGFNGCLKRNVIQLQKQRWYQLVIDQKSLNQSSQKKVELQNNIRNFKNCINQLNKASQRMEYLERKIHQKINKRSVCNLLLDKKFLAEIKKLENEDLN